MKEAITSTDVGEESVSQALASMSTLHQASDIHYTKKRWHLAIEKINKNKAEVACYVVIQYNTTLLIPLGAISLSSLYTDTVTYKQQIHIHNYRAFSSRIADEMVLLKLCTGVNTGASLAYLSGLWYVHRYS